jgi:hypothetical protein
MRSLTGEPPESWGIIYDISIHGLKIETRRPIKKDDTVFLSFVIAVNNVFESVRGKIVHVEEKNGYYMAGVEFDSVVDRNHLRDGLHAIIEEMML